MDRVRDGCFFDDEVIEAFARRRFSSGEASLTGADDDQIEHYAFGISPIGP